MTLSPGPPATTQLASDHAPPDEPSASTELTHARLVSALVHLLFALGFRGLRTGIHDSPSLSDLGDAGAHHPDITACSGLDTLNVFAVSTAASLGSEATARRLQALAAATEAKDAGLWLAVPAEARTEAVHRVRELGVSARVICV